MRGCLYFVLEKRNTMLTREDKGAGMEGEDKNTERGKKLLVDEGTR